MSAITAKMTLETQRSLSLAKARLKAAKWGVVAELRPERRAGQGNEAPGITGVEDGREWDVHCFVFIGMRCGKLSDCYV